MSRFQPKHKFPSTCGRDPAWPDPPADPLEPLFLTGSASNKGNIRTEVPGRYFEIIKELDFNETARRIGNPLEKIDFHALRHTFATFSAMNGVDHVTLKKLMGHKKLEMDKNKPYHSRVEIKRLIEEGKASVTVTAIRDAFVLGIGRSDILEMACSLTANDFCKSMTSHSDSKCWQDVYHIRTESGLIIT